MTFLAAACFAGGCASRPVEQLDEATYRIQCPGGYHDWSGCLRVAGRLCASYDVLSQVSDETSSSVGVNDWDNESTEVSRYMTVRCRDEGS